MVGLGRDEQNVVKLAEGGELVGFEGESYVDTLLYDLHHAILLGLA